MSTTIASDNPFTPAERSLIEALAGLMIPASAEYCVPGADDPLILQDLFTTASKDVENVRGCLKVLEAHENEGLAALEGNPAIAPLVTLIAQCYYRDDRVMASIGMEARAPFPQGFEVPQGDWSMLEKVQRRGKIWRDA